MRLFAIWIRMGIKIYLFVSSLVPELCFTRIPTQLAHLNLLLPWFSDRVGGGADFISVGDMDGDFDLDLIVAYQSTDEVVWYANDGATNFSVGGVVASSVNGLDEPRSLELFDANSSISIGNRFQSPDILIAAKGGIYFAANNGKGIFSVSKIIDIGSNLGLVVRAVNLDGNQWPDFVYTTSATGPPSYLLQGSSGFAQQASLCQTIPPMHHGQSILQLRSKYIPVHPFLLLIILDLHPLHRRSLFPTRLSRI